MKNRILKPTRYYDEKGNISIWTQGKMKKIIPLSYRSINNMSNIANQFIKQKDHQKIQKYVSDHGVDWNIDLISGENGYIKKKWFKKLSLYLLNNGISMDYFPTNNIDDYLIYIIEHAVSADGGNISELHKESGCEIYPFKKS